MDFMAAPCPADHASILASTRSLNYSGGLGVPAIPPVGSTHGGTSDALDALGSAYNSTCSPAGAKRRREEE